MKPFFSIIIPTLNEEEMLPRLLDDLARQKYRSFEIIVCDGKSTDKTKEVVMSYSDKFKELRFIPSPKKNLCFQRNYGADKAEGEYLIFLDADIQLYSTYLYEVHKEIKKSSSLFLTTYQLPDVRNKFDIMLIQSANFALEMLPIINKQMAPGYNFIVQKSLFVKVGKFDLNATFSEDHELSIRIWDKAGVRIKILPKKLLKWSFRRIKRDGRLPISIKYAYAVLYILVFGKITDKNFGYPMGGDYFKQLKKLNQPNLEEAIKKTFKKILGE